MAGIFTTITTTTPAVPGVVPMPVHARIDGTVARSDHFRTLSTTATMPRVREIYAQAYEANERLRARYAR